MSDPCVHPLGAEGYCGLNLGHLGEHVPDRIAKLRDALDAERALSEERRVMLEEAVCVLENTLDEGECWADHHGYCQAHGLESKCSVARGHVLLKLIQANARLIQPSTGDDRGTT